MPLHPTDCIVYTIAPQLGCDPEFFFQKEGQIVGSEKVIHTGGVTVVRDGVQAELHPRPFACRASLAGELAAAFKTLRTHLASVNQMGISLASVVEVSKQELDSLSEQSRVLGCQPSLNAYETASISVEPGCQTRSAGGHIHIGLEDCKELFSIRTRLVPLLDVLLGNTAVLFDRDPQAAERRKLYGRAGEYRLPRYGVEYRTLSNFWLQAYPLMSLVMGLARLSTNVLASSVIGRYQYDTLKNTSKLVTWDAESALLARVDLDAVQRAINENDLALAKRNWEQVKQFLATHVPQMNCGLDHAKIEAFEYFASVVQEKGLKEWFPEDPLTHWCTLPDGHGRGWESFLTNTVAPRMRVSRMVSVSPLLPLGAG